MGNPLDKCLLRELWRRQVREELRNLRGMWPQNPRQVSVAGGQSNVPRRLPEMQCVYQQPQPFLLHPQHKALLQSRLRQVRKEEEDDEETCVIHSPGHWSGHQTNDKLPKTPTGTFNFIFWTLDLPFKLAPENGLPSN